MRQQTQYTMNINSKRLLLLFSRPLPKRTKISVDLGRFHSLEGASKYISPANTFHNDFHIPRFFVMDYTVVKTVISTFSYTRGYLIPHRQSANTRMQIDLALQSAWWLSSVRRTPRVYCHPAIRGSSPAGSSSNSKVTGSCQEGIPLSRFLVASRRHVGCPLSKDI